MRTPTSLFSEGHFGGAPMHAYGGGAGRAGQVLADRFLGKNGDAVLEPAYLHVR